jgi:hypothetical protein
VAEPLPSVHEALGSILTLQKDERKKEKDDRKRKAKLYEYLQKNQQCKQIYLKGSNSFIT